MTDEQAPSIPLAGSTTVQGGSFVGEFKWFTVGRTAFVRHLVHSQQDLSPRDLEVFGQTLHMVADGLTSQGVEARFGVERPLGDGDPFGAAIAEAAGLAASAVAEVLRRRLPVEPGDPVRSSIASSGRPADPVADADAWAELASSVPELPGSIGQGTTGDEGFATVVEAPGSSALAAACWAQRMTPTAPGSPVTAEIIAVGTRAGDPTESTALERSALLAMADLVGGAGVRTLSACPDTNSDGLRASLEAVGFVARRSRHIYS